MTTFRLQRRAVSLLCLLGMTACLCAGDDPSANPAGMKKYIGTYHVLYTDLPDAEAKAALVRLTAMVEMYRGLAPGATAGEHGKWPVYLYRRFEDYRRSLGQNERPNAGQYDGLVLRAVLDAETFSLPSVWRVIQHEGWHQYSHRALQQGTPPPLWLEEGLAEYFAEATWKDGACHPGRVDAGAYEVRDKAIVLQPGRLQRIQTRIRTRQFRSLRKLVTMNLSDWRKQTNALNHDQVFSFVHFLLHADQGKRREALQAYLAEVLRNPPKKLEKLDVFQKHFGKDFRKLQEQYETWWLSQPTPSTVGSFQ
jgi:hypothetical protein